MGNKRIFTTCLSNLLLVAAAVSSQGQELQQAQRAYYQPLSQLEYAQHQRAAYQERIRPEWMNPGKKAQPFGPSQTHSQFSQPVASPNVAPRVAQPFGPTVSPKPAKPTLQQRAANLLQEQRATDAFNRSIARQAEGLVAPRAVEPGRIPMLPAGFGAKTQDDPFGENQSQNQGNVFDPFADPPKSQDPFGESQTPTPNTVPNPFSDPPKTQQPILPGEMGGNQESPLSEPVLPNDATLEPAPTPAPVEAPNQTEDPSQLTNPFDDPVPPALEPDYLQGRPYSERYTPPAGIYRAPQQQMPQNQLPPIVPPDQAPPMFHPGYSQQPYQAPTYQPAYQPIPGQQPYNAQPVQPYNAPAAPIATAPPATAPAPVANDVYSPVVATSNQCGSCGTACGGGCGLGGTGGLGNAGCPNFYFSVFGGWNGLRDMNSLASGIGEFQTDDGSIFGFALGRRNGRNLRTELEFSYRENNVTGFLSDSGVLTDLSGELNSYAGMANAYWEFVNFRNRLFKPYIGGGIGFISIDSDIRNANAVSILSSGVDNDTSLAYQYMLGMNYKAYRNVDLFVEYRYLKAESFRLDTTVGSSGRYNFASDNVLFGMRWKF